MHKGARDDNEGLSDIQRLIQRFAGNNAFCWCCPETKRGRSFVRGGHLFIFSDERPHVPSFGCLVCLYANFRKIEELNKRSALAAYILVGFRRAATRAQGQLFGVLEGKLATAKNPTSGVRWQRAG